ncbi:MAG: hypothetical protein IT430_15030 [Phycisphaerales bacterium]|nr:hypothetical protein [Phycisphaerales bacterium]
MDETPPASHEAGAGSPSSHRDILMTLDQLESSGKLDVLAFLGDQLHAEQSHYWNRWAALAALHAALLVVAVETSGWARTLTAVFGIGLAVVWIAIQARSREYVNRWKPFFHSYRRAQGLAWIGEQASAADSSKWASTEWAGLVPWGLLLPWVILAVLGIISIAA